MFSTNIHYNFRKSIDTYSLAKCQLRRLGFLSDTDSSVGEIQSKQAITKTNDTSPLLPPPPQRNAAAVNITYFSVARISRGSNAELNGRA